MVGICTVSKDGKLLDIKEVSDLYRYFDNSWEETSKDKILKWVLIGSFINIFLIIMRKLY